MPPIDFTNPFAIFIPLVGVFGLIMLGILGHIVAVDRKRTREEILRARRASRYKPEGRYWGFIAVVGPIVMLGALGYAVAYVIQHGIA